MTGVELYCGDCLEVMKEIEAGSVDAVVTDPPYGIALANHDIGNRRRASEYRIANDHSQEVGNIVLHWCTEHKLPTIVFANPMKAWPGKWRQFLVWDKGGAVGGGGDTFMCWKQTWELLQVARTGKLNGKRDSAILKFHMRPQDSVYHPAQKSLALMAYLIEKTTQPGDTVLDPFMGSGTTGVACVQPGRNFIGIEIDPHYFEIAQKRIAEAQAQMRLAI